MNINEIRIDVTKKDIERAIQSLERLLKDELFEIIIFDKDESYIFVEKNDEAR